MLQRARAEAVRELARLEQKKAERDWLARQSPAPTPESGAALAAEVEAASRRVEALRDGLGEGENETAAAPVAQPAEVYLELTAMIERMRAEADAAGVVLRPQECFGFAAHLNEGPPRGAIDEVRRQHRAIEDLLRTLWEARPAALIAVRRQAEKDRAGESGSRSAGDGFALDAGLSLRRDGLVKTEPVQFEFTGHTPALRAFLSGVASMRGLAVVRSVEVAPALTVGGGQNTTETRLFVRPMLSKFSVTAEIIQRGRAGEQAPP